MILLQLGHLRKFHATNDQTTRDQIMSDKMSKRA